MRKLKNKNVHRCESCWQLALVVVTVLLKLMEGVVIGVIGWKSHHNCTEEDFFNQTSKINLHNTEQDRQNLPNLHNIEQDRQNLPSLHSIEQDRQNLRHAISHLCVTAQSTCKLCPLNWIGVNNRCYFFSSERKTWKLSKKFIYEQALLKKGHFWTGLQKNGSIWHWQTGKELQGDVSVKEGTTPHDCSTLSENKFFAEFCNNPNKWICEKEMTEYSL
ncbi:C-type lectin domain family 1 member A-like isoform X2 [Pelobates fuscus]|uniref:C-type lectin domain family 1 member A-like isoform X2 n=1 Tax=Pelobates fuscus TaxID=191477 RepID=UPI002FE4F1E4